MVKNDDKIGEKIISKTPEALIADESNEETKISKYIILGKEEIAQYQSAHTHFSLENKFLVAFDSLEDVRMMAYLNQKSIK